MFRRWRQLDCDNRSKYATNIYPRYDGCLDRGKCSHNNKQQQQQAAVQQQPPQPAQPVPNPQQQHPPEQVPPGMAHPQQVETIFMMTLASDASELFRILYYVSVNTNLEATILIGCSSLQMMAQNFKVPTMPPGVSVPVGPDGQPLQFMVKPEGG